VLQFDKVENTQINSLVAGVFADGNLFVKPSASMLKEQIASGVDGAVVGARMTMEVQGETKLGVLPYGEFLKRLGKRTCLPVELVHRHLANTRHGKETPPEWFNTGTLENIIKRFEEKFAAVFAQKFSYAPLDFRAQTSLFEPGGDFKAELAQGDVGEKIASDVKVDGRRYLYDKAAYDSEIEHEVLRIQPPPRVIVYGKLPRRSIKLPTYTGGTTSPDFVYAIRKPDGEGVELHLIVETKSDNPRLSDSRAVEAQEAFFKGISKDIVWRMETDAEKFGRLLAEVAG
jgi:type III restriction enzyme